MTSSYKKSGVGGGAYYLDCMSSDISRGKTTDDYYSASGKEPPGTWYAGPKVNGSHASILGLVDGQIFGSIKDQDDVKRFSNLIKGLHPENGEKLVQNSDAKNRIALHDFTLSAPKSVSVLWSQADKSTQKSIERVQDDSARTFLDFMSKKSYTRIGKDGVTKVAAPLMGALFDHGSSRENDPQLHKHCVIFNLSERPDGKTGALETKEMMRWQGAATSLYHADLAWGFRQLGFSIEKKDNLFEVAGVPEEVCLAFSQRRQQIIKSVEEKLETMGLDADAKLASRGMLQAATIETRNQKNELTREQLIAVWHERGAALSFTEKEVTQLRDGGPAIELSNDDLLKEAHLAIAQITETNAVFKEAALITKIAVQLVGRASSEKVFQAVDMVKEKDLLSTYTNRRTTNAGLTQEQILEAENSRELIFTTREMLVLEHQILQLADRQDGKHILQDVRLPSNLDPEQHAAALKATRDQNAVTVIEGTVSTSKNFIMAAISRAYEAAGYEVTGLGNSWNAALNSKHAGNFENRCTITDWINDVKTGTSSVNEKSLIVLDEAEIIGAKAIKQILEICNQAGAKVILFGDTLQQKAIFAGDPLRNIVKQNGTFRLDVIRHQLHQEEREAVSLFFAGKAKEGLTIYMDKLHCHDNLDAVNEEIISSWQKRRIEKPDKSHLILAMDKKSVHELNLLAHAVRKAAGELGESVQTKTMDCKKDEFVELSINDQIVFRANDKRQNIFNRIEGTLEQINGSKLYVRTKDALIEVDTALEEWQHKDGGLALQHAYVTSVFSSQELTVDRVILKDGLGLSRASAGVAMSRHRDHCEIHIDMQARYESKISMVPADQWHEFSLFTKEECIARMGTSWSTEREKNSTLDFADWQNLGTKVDAEKEVLIQASVDQKNRLLEQKIAALQTPGKLSLAERLSRAVQTGAAVNADFQATTSPTERLGELAGAIKAPILVNIPLPFQLAPTYRLDAPRPSQSAISVGIERLWSEKIDDEVIAEARRQGFVSFDNDGQSVFLGRRPDDNALVLILKGAPEDQKPEALRHRYPPILHADPAQVDVVKTGQDALALWSLQDRNETPRSTVIVTSGREEALFLPHIQDMLEKAETVQRYDLNQGNDEIAQMNKNAAQEVQKASLQKYLEELSR